MTLVNEDYETITKQVSDAFIKEGTPLNDSILKVAETHDLNPDQIKRLVEGSNVKTFLGMYKDARAKEEDTKFDVADAESILSKYYSGTKTASALVEEPASDSYINDFDTDLPDMAHQKYRPDTGDGLDYEKVAEEVSTPRRDVAVFRLRKVAEDFKVRIFEEEHEYVEKLEKMAERFRPDYGPNYEEFEKEARGFHGNSVDQALLDLRSLLGKGTELEEPVKVAHTLVVESENDINMIAEITGHKVEQIKYAKAYQVTQEKLKRVSK